MILSLSENCTAIRSTPTMASATNTAVRNAACINGGNRMKVWMLNNTNLVLAILWAAIAILNMINSPHIGRDSLFFLWGALVAVNLVEWYLRT